MNQIKSICGLLDISGDNLTCLAHKSPTHWKKVAWDHGSCRLHCKTTTIADENLSDVHGWANVLKFYSCYSLLCLVTFIDFLPHSGEVIMASNQMKHDLE